MNKTISVSIPTDDDGFVSQECPTCNRKFKVVFDEGCDRPIGHCPYCGHEEEGCWWTQEQVDYFANVAGDELTRPLLDDFTRKVNRISRPGDFISIKASIKHDPPPVQPAESEELMSMHEFSCCHERIKHDGTENELCCIICGVQTKVM